MKKLSLLILIAFLLNLVVGCELISKTPEGEAKTVVAKVNGEKITKGEFDKLFQSQIVQYEMMYGEGFASKPENADMIKSLKEDILTQMINEKLIIQKANELKVVPDDKTIETEVNKLYDDAVKQAGGEDKFKSTLETFKMTVDDFKKYMSNRVIIEKVYDEVVKDVTVTDDELIKYYNENMYDYTEKPNKMNVSHILVEDEATAKKVLDEINKGAKFEDVAKKYSTDPGSKDNGGNLGDIYYNDDNYDKTFMTNAIALPVGKISPIVKTQFGYHIIKVNKKEEYKLKPFEQVKDQVKEVVLENKKTDKINETFTNWEKEAKITKYTDRL
ncbi:Foldase protein PrsA 1 precursor [Caloramator mitchellensis]|uniref:peptidylprolyl isomerase n=1 Tax=Caloramator mitchellensis TaxID=908809 RepID=A0A0R3JZJ2_CALMK|nr:peptidylprolyl isomerase [Caloramator mitchellensis]KRQ86686.1 Foldase protein PrsA 1 precursor [Caloramator mitchellensis]